MVDLEHLYDVTLDLTRSMVASDRYGRLLEAIRRVLPCDATALLKVDGDALVPLATHGLTSEALGLRFKPEAHPRLQIICDSNRPVRFPEDSSLPDPFDGLIEGGDHSLDHVHSCLGCPLRIEGELVGVLTADALRSAAFDEIDEDYLAFLGALAGAVIRTNRLIEVARSIAEHQGAVARHLHRERQAVSGEMVGTSAALERLRSEILLVARSDLSVLITGETGVGKELVARAVHDASPRDGAPLIHVNCAALPESVAESELFGHERGAFTGADRQRSGKFEVARGGTLFLDEVGELPVSLQPKLLRAIQDGEIQRVGSDEALHVDVRIVAATNRDLVREVEQGRFRADLFHRLSAFPLHVPALRERRDDVPVLAGYFGDIARRRLGTGPVRLTPEASNLLRGYDWPGNVRELQNVVSRAVLRSAGGDGAAVVLDAEVVAPELVGPGRRSEPPAATEAEGRSLKDMVEDFKRTVIEEAIEREHGNLAAAARVLGVHRSNLHATVRRLGISRTR